MRLFPSALDCNPQPADGPPTPTATLADFVESALETRDQFPTSFYHVAMDGNCTWETGTIRVGGEGGWIATRVMASVSTDGRKRRWQWEMRRRRGYVAPGDNPWYVESIGSSDRKGEFHPEGGGDGGGDGEIGF